MRVCPILTPSIVLAVSLAAAGPLWAAGRVQLELVGDAQNSALAFQQWAQTLSQAGVENVRIRSGRGADEVGIQVQGTQQNRLYVVTGIIKSADELVLPSGRYSRRDVGRLAAWLDELAKLGPEDQREPKAAFDLTAKQFEQLHQELARPVGISTQGLTRREAVEKIAGRLSLPLKLDAEQAKTLEADKVAEDLAELSCGTVLAYVLRPAGLCLVPRRQEDKPGLAVAAAKPGMEIWPVGWEPDKPRPELLPAMFEFRNVNVENVSATTALEAIAQRLGIPALLDHNALARHGLNPAEVIVSHPRARTTYSIALRKILFQAELTSELRVDEAGKPFLWITSVKPI